VEEVEKARALVEHGRREIVLEVVLGVVHADVVAVVALGRLAEEGTHHPREVMVEQAEARLEERPVAGVVEQQNAAVEEAGEEHD